MDMAVGRSDQEAPKGNLAGSLGSIKLYKQSWTVREIWRRPEKNGERKQAKSSKSKPQIVTNSNLRYGRDKEQKPLNIMMEPNC